MVRRRLLVLAAVIVLPYLIVVLRLWSLQGSQEAHVRFLRREYDQTTLEILLPPRRGRFLDRDGRPLAVNRAAFDLVVRRLPVLLYARRRLLDGVLDDLRRAGATSPGGGDALEGQSGETLERWILRTYPPDRYLDPPVAGEPELVPVIVGLPPALRRSVSERIADYRAGESRDVPEAFVLRAVKQGGRSTLRLEMRPRRALYPERMLERLLRTIGDEVSRSELAARLERHRKRIEDRLTQVEEDLLGSEAEGDTTGSRSTPPAASELSDRAVRRKLRGEVSAFRSWTWPLREDISPDAVTRLEYRHQDFPDLEVWDVPRREYPLGEATGSLLGYLQRYRALSDGMQETLRERDGTREFRRGGLRSADSFVFEREGALRDSDLVGADGLEGRFDARLRGTYGLRVVHCNSRHEPGPELVRVLEQHGRDLPTTLDSDLQTLLYEAVRERCRPHEGACRAGSVVVIDLRPEKENFGALRAVVSFPSYDPHALADGDPAYRARMDAEWSDEGRWPQPWQRISWTRQRAVYQALYPGSVFKVLVALAAFESGHEWEGPLTYDRRYPCPGKYEFGPQSGDPLTCHYRTGGGHNGLSRLDLVDALRYSCNNYFYYMVHKHLDVAELHDWALDLGFGRHPGFYREPWEEVDGHRARLMGPAAGWAGGLLVDPRPPVDAEEERRRDARALRKRPELQSYAVCRYGIGQVYVEATPLQVARFMGAVALRGRLVPTPWIVTPLEPEVSTRALGVRAATWEAIGRGLWGAAHDPHGTAGRAELGIRDYAVAVKTGTAQFRKFKDSETELYHGWLAGFGPLPEPRFAFAICLEATPQFGGPACAPVARALLGYLEASGACPGLLLDGAGGDGFPGWEVPE